MSALRATVTMPCVLQAAANAVSASRKMNPPWDTPWPLIMSAPTVIRATAWPGRTSETSMPTLLEAASAASIRATLSSARRCALSVAMLSAVRWGPAPGRDRHC
jgi:hypothetical protein